MYAGKYDLPSVVQNFWEKIAAEELEIAVEHMLHDVLFTGLNTCNLFSTIRSQNWTKEAHRNVTLKNTDLIKSLVVYNAWFFPWTCATFATIMKLTNEWFSKVTTTP